MQNQLNTEGENYPTNDYELLVRMSWKDDQELKIESEKAFSEFYRKYQNYVLTVTRRVCRFLYYPDKEEMIKELFNDIFKHIYEKSETVRAAMEKHQHKNAVEFRKILHAYIGKLANSELKRYVKKETEYRENHKHLEAMAFFDPSVNPDFDGTDHEPCDEEGEAMKLGEYGLAQLSPLEQDVLTTIFLYNAPGKDLPDTVIREICDRHGITSGYMRVIKSRAMKKFTQAIAEKGGLKPLQTQQEKSLPD